MMNNWFSVLISFKNKKLLSYQCKFSLNIIQKMVFISKVSFFIKTPKISFLLFFLSPLPRSSPPLFYFVLHSFYIQSSHN